MTRSAHVPAAIVGLLAMLAAAPLGAQAVRGVVQELGAETPITAAEILLLDTVGSRLTSVASDTLGRFALRAPLPGAYRLRVERVGYETVESPVLRIDGGEVIDVQVELGIEAVALEPIIVTERRDYAPHARAFYERLERRRGSLGRFFTRQEIENRGTPTLSGLLHGVTRVRMRYDSWGHAHVSMGSGSSACVPTIYIDGLAVSDELYSIPIDQLITPDQIEGMEVYRSSVEAPVQYWDSSGCGLILIWTYRGADSDRPSSWARTLVGASLFVLLLVLGAT